MAIYEDAKHRPHAIHTGEEPRNPITNGPESLSVTLDRWGPVSNLFTSMYDALQANWGEQPSRTVDAECKCADDRHYDDWPHLTGWCQLTSDQKFYVESCFAGKTLQQVLEGITFDFCIDGVSRAFTHQNVRTRLGAGFMQHGGRDNDWRHRAWTMPETMRRMCEAWEHDLGAKGLVSQTLANEYLKSGEVEDGLKHSITNWMPIVNYMIGRTEPDVANGVLQQTLSEAIAEHINNGRILYSVLVDAGIPWQDARRVLFMGMQTYIHDQYNYLALSGMLANRLEHVMDWEHNCVAQLMLREVKMKCPPLLSKFLGSHSDKAKQARFAGLESWPPDNKYPNPYADCQLCGHAVSNHRFYEPGVNHELKAFPDEAICAVCERGSGIAPLHKCVPVDRLPRQHRPEQNPFWVLHPDSMAGGPVVWIPTNGTYPHDKV